MKRLKIGDIIVSIVVNIQIIKWKWEYTFRTSSQNSQVQLEVLNISSVTGPQVLILKECSSLQTLIQVIRFYRSASECQIEEDQYEPTSTQEYQKLEGKLKQDLTVRGESVYKLGCGHGAIGE